MTATMLIKDLTVEQFGGLMLALAMMIIILNYCFNAATSIGEKLAGIIRTECENVFKKLRGVTK